MMLLLAASLVPLSCILSSLSPDFFLLQRDEMKVEEWIKEKQGFLDNAAINIPQILLLPSTKVSHVSLALMQILHHV